MEPELAGLLAPFVTHRFQSFAQAADAAMAMLEQAVPGTLMLGQLEPGDEVCRAIDVRGAVVGPLDPGSVLPLAKAVGQSQNGSAGAGESVPGAGNRLDPDFLDSLSVASSLTMPLDLSDGSAVGLLCALDVHESAYRAGHWVLVSFAARLLSYEWESVHLRAELRSLREQVRDAETTDDVTGLPNRQSFLEVLDREWKLNKRGTVKSAVIAVEVGLRGRGRERSSALAVRSLKDAADVLEATARGTDRLGRTGSGGVAAVLTGCDADGAQAFVRRYEAALERATSGRPVPVSVSFGVEALDQAGSSAEALEAAEQRARESRPAADVEPDIHQPTPEAGS
jgi:diguanylate cyclase (GGDEF)-like protein